MKVIKSDYMKAIPQVILELMLEMVATPRKC